MILPVHLDKFHFVESFDQVGDRETTNKAVEFLQDRGIDLLLIYMGDYDVVSHESGGLSSEALQSVGRLDHNLCALFAHIDLSDTVLIVTSDHGHLDEGGHGGDEKVVLETPFVMAGSRVRPGSYPAIQQPDIAMTIASLLGMPFPRSGQGTPLYGFYDVSDSEREVGELALVRQKSALAKAYLSSIHAEVLPRKVDAELAELSELGAAEHFTDARVLAATVLYEINEHIGDARATQINQNRLVRLPIALLVAVVILTSFVVNWRSHHRGSMLASVLAVSVFHLLYFVGGQTYSWSTLGRTGVLPYFLAIMSGGGMISFLVGILAYRMMRAIRHRPTAFPSTFLSWLAAYSSGLLGLPYLLVLASYVANGKLGSWNFVSPTLSFLQSFSLLQVSISGLLALLTMFVALIHSSSLKRTGI